jgi:RND family efflux transporter MFP subunit
MQKKRLFIITALLIFAVAAGGYYYLKPVEAPKKRNASLPGATVRAERRDIRFNIDVTGDVSPAQQVEIKPEVSGRIMQLHTVAGQQVKKGDVLVELDDRDLRTERQGALIDIERAKLVVERTKADFERGEGLFEAKLSSQEKFDSISNDLAMAENALSKAQRSLQSVDDKLTKTRILSPTDGTVLTLPVVEGQVVTAAASVNSGTSLMTVANLSNLIVVTQINQVDVAKLSVGQKLSLTMEALKEPPMTATIRFIAPVATTKNSIKGFQVEASIENPSPRLRPGMTVNLSLPLDSAENAVSLPVNAIFTDGDDKVVYVRRGLRTEKRKVQLGVTNYFYTQILSGVEPGEEVSLTAPQPTGGGRKG